ncbi:exodeoxyribonuclease V alpha subunit [Natronocella acetinitrilica]|uniref:RecBCD enzyme subunit RecD n=1 Tax=Natronocella acetinitrilica TaxID=414046 RepID=A0AAE3KD76_9GAMM|nr:exodeoxyribonuclease V alpha subunit [Natronocella acetinitrilica]
MSGLLERIAVGVDEGRLRPLDRALADWCLRHGGTPAVALAMVLANRALEDGHTCLQIPEPGPALPGERPFMAADAFIEALTGSPLVGGPEAACPLILDQDRLYIERYWRYETRLAARLNTLAATPPAPVDVTGLLPGGADFDYSRVADGEPHWQAVAAFTAERHQLCVISGGPGTGKTYTVVRLMWRLIRAALQRGDAPPVIRLAAPTGKAAARMMESIRDGLTAMNLDAESQAACPQQASTLHRLLGFRQGSVRPRHDADNPLPADVVIVDEASMVDLPMMAKLAEALPDHCRLVLLGDRYQLASVESGSILAELCDAGGVNVYSPAQRQAGGELLATLPADTPSEPLPLRDHVVTLQTSHRFARDSGIGRLASLVNAGDVDGTIRLLQATHPDLAYSSDSSERALDALCDEQAQHYLQLQQVTDPAQALTLIEQRRLLTATRVGPSGSDQLNQRISARLAHHSGAFEPGQRDYHGRPVIITRNDYRAGLFNGDTGIMLRDAEGNLRVWFRAEQGLRRLLPSAIPHHETVYAMTVHKSQGSEFDHVTLLLPEGGSTSPTRELLYTGITRARQSLCLTAGEDAVREAVGRQTLRGSGLALRLQISSR